MSTKLKRVLVMYSEHQLVAAETVVTICQDALNFPHKVNDVLLVLELCATTNPDLKRQPKPTPSHLAAWKAEQESALPDLVKKWTAEIINQAEAIAKVYLLVN